MTIVQTIIIKPMDEKKVILMRSILQSSATLFLAKAFIPASYIVVTICIARILGLEAFGKFSIVYSYYAVLRMISFFGIDNFLIKEITNNRQKADVYLGNAYILGTQLSLANMVIMNLVLMFVGYSWDIRVLGFFVSLELLPDSLIRYSESVFIAFVKNRYIFFTALARESFRLAAVIFALAIYKSAISVVIAFLATSILGFILDYIIIENKFFRQKIVIKKDIMRNMFCVSFILALISGFSNLFSALDIIILSKIKGEIPVALYSVAYKFILASFFITDSVGTSFLPVMINFYNESLGKFKRSSNLILKYFSLSMIAIIVFTFFFSDKLVLLIFGSQFALAAGVLKVLIWSALFSGCAYFFARMLFVAGLQKYDLIAIASACLVNIVFNIPLTLAFGYYGTAVSAIIAALYLCIVEFYFLRQKILKINLAEIFLKPLLAGAVLFITFFYLARVNLYLGALIAGLAYIFMLFKFKIIRKEEFNLIAQAIWGKR